jgi:integrase/recombinase XerD
MDFEGSVYLPIRLNSVGLLLQRVRGHMGLGKQAKTLSKGQVTRLITHVQTTRYPLRNVVIVLLSMKAGLRAKEIANLTWEMVTDPEGNLGRVIRLPNRASKGQAGGRVIPLNAELRSALATLSSAGLTSPYVVASERGPRVSSVVVVNMFASWYRTLGFKGCSSHSGRRTFITSAARQISMVGGSLRDVQMLAGHATLSTTQRYIDADVEAQKKIVNLI